jgi:hypothetical protein
MASAENRKYHLSDGVRQDLLTEIREIALPVHRQGIDALVVWAEGGFKGDAPIRKGLTQGLRDALVDDLEYIFQEPLKKGWFAAQYERRYVRRRRLYIARGAAKRDQFQNSLSDLLKF